MNRLSSRKQAQTVVICTEPGAGEGAIGACGGIGSRESAWIEAHDANGRGCGLSAVIREGLITEASRSRGRNRKRCRGRLRVLSVRNELFWIKGHECRGLRKPRTFSAGGRHDPSSFPARINYRRYVSPSSFLPLYRLSFPTTTTWIDESLSFITD